MSLHPLSEGTAAIERVGDGIRSEHDGAVQWASSGRGEQVCECQAQAPGDWESKADCLRSLAQS